MNEKSSYIRVGFYENFKGFDSVLFSVDLEGLIEIEKVFLQLSESINDFDFKNLKLIDKDFCIDIKAFVDKENLGLKQIEFEKYEWRLTSKVWSIFRQQLTGLRLCSNDNGGHQYLDSEINYFEEKENFIDTESLQVVFSLFEYSLSFWQEWKLKI